TDLMIEYFGKLDQFEPEKIPYTRIPGLKKAIVGVFVLDVVLNVIKVSALCLTA
ncbi:hypothetical protein BGX34_001448, partial [Mortierella sp. NVP85]